MHAQRRVIVVGRSFGLWVSPHVFSQTVAAVDTKCGYVGMCSGRLAQQEYKSGVVQEQYVYGGGLKLYTAIILGVH